MLPDAKLYEQLGIDAPTSISHGVTADNIAEKLLPANPRNWRLIGNVLHCDTDHGPIAQTIDPAYIMRGLSESGLPNLVKVA